VAQRGGATSVQVTSENVANGSSSEQQQRPRYSSVIVDTSTKYTSNEIKEQIVSIECAGSGCATSHIFF
jgi:flagellar basal body rod protein FlgC